VHNEGLHNFCPSKDSAYYVCDIIKGGTQVSSVRIVTELPVERPWRQKMLIKFFVNWKLQIIL